MLQHTEVYLDWIERHGKAGKVTTRKANQVKRSIQQLRDFADSKPGTVADNCNAVANKWNERLEAVLARRVS